MMRGVLLYELIFIIWYYSYITQIFHCDTGWRDDEGVLLYELIFIIWYYSYISQIFHCDTSWRDVSDVNIWSKLGSWVTETSWIKIGARTCLST